MAMRPQGGGSTPRESASAALSTELFRHRFASVAEEMGEVLRRTSVSVNVKERLDFSCAVLDGDGRLVVNAPHIPVHLGALGECVRAVESYFRSRSEALEHGDCVVTNHPGFGGSHLPDVTVISPVFVEGERIAYVANRAHHAEIGGRRPGSMPPRATTLIEEGVVLAPLKVIRGGEARWRQLEERLRGARYPSRSVPENLADLRAAVAANRKGEQSLVRMAELYGTDAVRDAMTRLREIAAERMREALAGLANASGEATERLDDGSVIHVSYERAGDRLTIDFAGTSPTHPGNLNATSAIVASAVLYVLRVLVDEPLPLNEGLYEPIDLEIPPGMLNPHWPDDPAQCPAVVGGNVETSQRVVDTLLKAFELAACSQGTMNNTLFGDDSFGYYETVAGGAGAGPGFAGASGVHTHMTNTRITDPEILELRYPVQLERFGLRSGSGGAGRFEGGEGVRREIVFERALSVSMLTQHRVERPYGLMGGAPGEPGRQWVERVDGTRVELASVDSCDVEAGDRLVVLTPGGGGYGSPDPPSDAPPDAGPDSPREGTE